MTFNLVPKSCAYLYVKETEIYVDEAKMYIRDKEINCNGDISGEMRFQNRQL